MKTSTQTTVVLKALDMELKALIQNDLAKFKEIQISKTTHNSAKQLIAA